MKKWVHSSISTTDNVTQLNFTIEVVFGYDVGNIAKDHLAASTHPTPDLPKGPLPSGKKGELIGVQALADYHAFIESIEELIGYYDLEICYKNESKDESHYYTCLAKNTKGDFILDFKLRIRIADHDAHDSEYADAQKRNEKSLMHSIEQGKKLKVLFISLVLNEENEEVHTYAEAYLWMDDKIEKKAEIMKRRLKYEKD